MNGSQAACVHVAHIKKNNRLAQNNDQYRNALYNSPKMFDISIEKSVIWKNQC
jgi:hypothetical protein